MTLAIGSFALAQGPKWKPCPPGMQLKPGDKVLVNTHRGWAEGTVVGFFGHGTDMPRVEFMDPTFGRQTRPFRMEEIRIPVKPTKKRAPRATAGKGENPFEAPDPYREWSDSSGKFKIEAELIEKTDEEVVLKKRDGSEIAVPLERLSEKDQEYLESLESEEGGSDNPYAGEAGVIQPDWSGATGVMLGMNVKPANLEPDGGPGAMPLMKRVVKLPPKGSFFEKVTGIFPAAAEVGVTAVGVYCDFGDRTYSGIYLCDLKERTGKVRQIEVPDKTAPLEIGPHGEYLITRSGGKMSHDQTRMSLWKIDGKKCVKQWDCYPYAGGRGHFRSGVSWAKFVDESHLLTYGGGSRLVLWKLPDMKAVYSVELKSGPHSIFQSGTTPTLSPGRKYLAVLGPGAINVLETKTGEVVGSYQGAGNSGSIVFRPDGKRIALTTPTRVQAWEFSTGEMYRDIGFSTQYNRLGDATWPAPGYILIGGRYLIDLEHHSLLWEYRPADGAGAVATTQMIGRRLWFLATSENQRAFVPFTVPHEAVRAMIPKIRPEDTLVLQPGMEVALDVKVDGTPAEQDKIREAFEKNLRDNGFQLVESGPVRVVARTERGEIEEMAYQEFGASPFRPEPTHRGTFQGYISRVTLSIDDKVAWQVTSVTSAPHHLSLQGGESVAQALKRHEKVDLGFFTRIVLPRYLCVPRDKYTFGATEMTSSGPRPVEPTPRKKPEKRPPAVPGKRA